MMIVLGMNLGKNPGSRIQPSADLFAPAIPADHSLLAVRKRGGPARFQRLRRAPACFSLHFPSNDTGSSPTPNSISPDAPAIRDPLSHIVRHSSVGFNALLAPAKCDQFEFLLVGGEPQCASLRFQRRVRDGYGICRLIDCGAQSLDGI